MGVRPLSSALKIFEVLDLIGRSNVALRLIEIARAVDEPRAAVHQRLVTLAHGGLVEQDGEGRYRLSLKVVNYSTHAMEQANLGVRTTEILQETMAEAGETVSLAVLERMDVVIVQRIEAKGMLRADLRIGTRMSLATSASGRAISAFSTPQFRAQLAQHGATLADPELLEQTRAAGYAVSEPQGPRTVTAVAAPIFNPSGICVAAMSISGPADGFDIERCGRLARDAASRVSARFSSNGGK